MDEYSVLLVDDETDFLETMLKRLKITKTEGNRCEQRRRSNRTY